MKLGKSEQCNSSKPRESEVKERAMHSNPFVVPSAPAKNYYYRIEDYPRIEVGAKHFRSFNEMSRQRILNPHENDVLMGRGGKNNQHSGNERLRQIARLHCESYRSSSKKEKSNLSRHLVREMRSLNPPARFLKRDNETGMWEEVGDDTAREKASQVLRDAVATLSENPEPVHFAGPSNPAPPNPVPSAVHEIHNTTLSYEGTPTLESVPSDPAPSSDSDIRRSKRRRYAAPRRSVSDSYYPYHMAESSTPVARRHSEHPRQVLHVAPVRHSRRTSLDATSGGGLNEFDLLQGELLESDPEDVEDSFPHSHHL